MTKLMAEYCVRKWAGYTILISKEYYDPNLGYFWEDIDIYEAGNSAFDSQASGYAPLPRNTLMKYARQTAREMLIEHGDPKGQIVYNGDLMPKKALNWSPLREQYQFPIYFQNNFNYT